MIGGLLYVSVYRIGSVEAAQVAHASRLDALQHADAMKETRLQLLERAVLSLERMAGAK
jgi:hypothetical protein